MIEGWDPTEIIACALRPQGSWMHLATLVGFVCAAWLVSPKARLARIHAPEPRKR